MKYIFVIVFLGLLVGLDACDPLSTTVENTAERPKFHPNYNRMSDIWLGELEFVDFFCGWPYDVTNRQKRAVQEGREAVPKRLTPDELNTLKLDHSFVYFRGQTFEWGASMMVNFNNGTINRYSSECTNAVWRRQGNSACSLKQAQQLASKFYQIFGSYNLLTNNCHNFAEWFMRNLSEGNCKF